MGRAILTWRYKYVVYDIGQYREQLFDMAADPGEMVNLAVCSRYEAELQAHRDRLVVWCRRTGDGFTVSRGPVRRW